MDVGLILEQLGLGAGGNATYDLLRGMLSRFASWADAGELNVKERWET